MTLVLGALLDLLVSQWALYSSQNFLYLEG